MIPQIREINFPEYATLHQATVNLSTMGDRTITTQIRVDGSIAPEFGITENGVFKPMELEFRGERFILPTREPQARKDTSTKNSLIDLTFYSWPVYELKRYFFVEMSSTTSGTAIADKYDASLALNLENFVDAFNLVLDHYFNGKIQISLFGQGQGIYSTDPVFFEINYTKLWEVLQKVYEMYNVRWWFDYDSASDIYLIKMGYTADSIDDHDFSYGYKGGLLSFERTVQSDDLVNILLGRGGEKNLPYRYFKRTDPDNPGWTADPDAIPELANIYFDRLHDINFRWYVRGWMTNPNRDRSWEQEGYVYPTYSISPDSPYYFAYQRGATDAKFNPVEYVKDDESIAAHGEVWGALDDNDDIYPTIQGVDIPNDSPDIGRVDEAVAISQIETDDISAYASAAAVETTIKDMKVSLPGNNVLTHTIYSEPFTIAQGETGNVTYRPFSKETVYPNFVYYDTTRSTLVAEPLSGGSDQPGTASYDESTGLYAVSGLPAGTYRLKLNLFLRVDRPATVATGTFGIENVVLTTSAANTNAWKPTFDIWVKNIWQTTQGTNESNKDYAERVWGPILGDRLGDEAKIVFSTGAMSISQDYEFVIADYPVPDRTKTLNGVPSEWKITVYKSDAEYQATGLYIPNASSTQPLAGDKFFFVGIDMPFQYVEWAEERLNQYKTDNLEGMSEISPTWTLKLDKVRINSLEDEDYGQKLADRLDAGVMIRTTDPRFTHGDILSLYIQSITWTWNEPSKGNPYIVPDVEVILADKVSAVESPISRLENDVDVISQTYVQSGDVEAVVRRVAGALFLKKTGESDSSSSPTTFSSKVTSRNFRKGGIGGAGWGLYEDNSRKFSQSSPATRADVSDEEETIEPRTVLEVDRLVVREEMEVNNLVINQISARGGREIISAARIETTLVRETSTSYVCYFDQKQNSVANLFQVNDIAYGQVWSADNMELRFYKMLVTAVDVNSITLAKAGRYGSGAPQEGDVIVQYGNTTDARRQYVIIRDVVGGGHDRMLSGLNSVSAEGVEYYYAGVETGDTPRWFVGDREAEYAEYKDGVLNIKGQLSVLKSDGSYQAMSDYIDQVNANETNLQNQIDNNIQSWSASASPLPISDGGTVDPTTANYPASQWEDDETRLKHVGDIYTDETSGQSYRYTRLPNDGDFYWMRISDEEAAQALQQANQALQGLAGLNYLKAATNNGSTLVDGGLILSNLIALGKTEEGVFNIYSGINGIMDPNAYGNGIAAWYGGPMTDHEAEPTEALYANSLFRFDGSGYLAGGLLKWGLDNGAAFLTLNGQAVVGGLGGTTLNDIANLLFDVVQYKTGHYAVKLRPNAYYGGNLVAIDGLYAEGLVSAGGVSEQGGGGGGTGYLRDLLDVNASMSPTQGQALVWDDALGKWTAGDVSVDLTPFERTTNKVTNISASSTDGQYPSARAVYNAMGSYLPLAGGTMTGDILQKMTADTSNYRAAFQWVNTSGVRIAEIGYMNTAQSVFINPQGSTDAWSDAAGKYSLKIRPDNNGLTFNTNKVWHAGNDGSGSGLDADTVDGKHNGDLTARTCGYLGAFSGAGTTVADCKAWLAQIFSDSAFGVGDNCFVGTSYIENWDNDSAAYDPSYVHSFIKIGGGYNGVNYGQWLLSSFATNRIGYVGRSGNQWTDIKWLANTEDIDSCAKLASPNNLMHSGNEFTFIPPNYNNNIWFNYRTSDLSSSGNVTGYYFGDGKGNALAYITDGQFSGNAASATKLQAFRSIWGQNFDGSGNVSGNMTGVNSDNTTGIGTAIAIGCPSVDGLSAAGNGVGITMGISGESYYAKIATVFEGSNPSYLKPALAFYTMYNSYEAGSEVERMRISANGNVGIGTTSPERGLDVVGSLQAGNGTYEAVLETNSDGGRLTFWSNSSLWHKGYIDGSTVVINTITGGNVGIGTSSPYTKLEISSALSAPDATNVASSAMLALNQHNNDGLFFGYASPGDYGWIQAAYFGTSANPSEQHTYQLSLNPLGGNVGIGTVTAAYKLDIAGDSRISGKVYIGTSGGYLEVVNVGTESAPEYALHSTLPFYSDSFVSAGGLSGTGEGGGATYLKNLLDVDDNLVESAGYGLVYDGTQWTSEQIVPASRKINGVTLTSDVSLSLGSLSNVSVTGATNGQQLIYNGSEWIAGTPAGAKFFHGTCSTSSSSNTKVVDCPSFTSADLVAGTAIAIVMYNRSDTTSTVTINVNSTGANTLVAGFANRKAWSAQELILAIYDGSGVWDMLPTWYYTYYYGGGGSGGGGGTGSTVVVHPSQISEPKIEIATISVDGTGYKLFAPSVSVSQTQGSTGGTQIASINSTAIYAPAVTVTQVQTSGVEVARIKVGSANPVSIYAPSGSSGSSGVQTVVGRTGDVTTDQIAAALTNAGYKLTDTVQDLSGYLPLTAGSSKALTNTLYTRGLLPTANASYDLGSLSAAYNNTYTKRVYLADGVYIEYDSTNRCVYVHGAGIATDSFVSAGGVSNT